MSGNSPFKKEDLVRTHTVLPRWLHEKVKASAEANTRSYSGQIVSILKGMYGENPNK